MAADGPHPLLSVESARVEYLSSFVGQPTIVALNDVSVDIDVGDFVHMCGGNGSGKSTLLRALAGMVPLSAGTVRVRNRVVQSRRVPRHVSVAMVYQDLDEGIVPLMSIRDHMALKLYHSQRGRLSFQGARAAAAGYLHERPFLNDLLGRLEDEAAGLSGGWKQLLQIVAAISSQPELLLLDEPTSHLSDEMRQLADNLIVSETQSSAVIYVSHLAPSQAVRSRLTSKWKAENGNMCTIES